jgi:hypothetical protein
MDLNPYLAELHEQLAVAADTGGDEARALAERLSASLDSAARLALLDALSAAAAEITQELAPGSVEVRLRGRDPEFVVNVAKPVAETVAEIDEPVAATGEDAAMTRINLRLPQDLKDRVEDAARASGVSVNTWLVRSASAALSRGAATTSKTQSSASRGQRYSGWVR